jgi:hypothetical protein
LIIGILQHDICAQAFFALLSRRGADPYFICEDGPLAKPRKRG